MWVSLCGREGQCVCVRAGVLVFFGCVGMGETVWMWVCACDCVGEEGCVWVGQP